MNGAARKQAKSIIANYLLLIVKKSDGLMKGVGKQDDSGSVVEGKHCSGIQKQEFS